MRVLYVTHFGALGGAERSLLEIMAAVRDRGVRPVLLTPPGPLERAAAAAGVLTATWCARPVTRSWGRNAWWLSSRRFLLGWRQMRESLRAYRPDIVHVNSTQAMLWIGPPGFQQQRPVVWHWRDFHDLGPLVRLMARSTRAIVSISKSIHTFASASLGALRQRLILIPNGV